MYMNFSSFQMTVGAIDIKCVTTGSVCCSLLARATQSANVKCNEVPNENEAKLYRSVKKLENCDHIHLFSPMAEIMLCQAVCWVFIS